MHLIVDPGKVGDRRTLSDTSELVVDGSVTKADPTLIRTEVRNGNATQVSANSRRAHN